MSQSPNVGSVTPTSRAKDLRAKKLGVTPRTLWSNDQDPALLVIVKGDSKDANFLCAGVSKICELFVSKRCELFIAG